MSPIKQVILKVAERCNINCSYCYMYEHADQGWQRRPKFMSDEVFTRTLLMLRSYCDRHRSCVSLSLHGGEPTLAGCERVEAWSQFAGEVLGSRLEAITLQTNGTLLDDEWIDVIRRQRLSIGLSMDGPADVHDHFRVDARGQGTHARTLEGLERLQRAGIPFIVLCVINPFADGGRVYRYFRELGVRRMELMMPDYSHDSVHKIRASAMDTPIANFLIKAFDAWIEEDDPDVEIRLLWGLVRRLMGGAHVTDAFGNPKLSYLTVESDGSIEGNDVLKICDEGLGRVGLNVLTDSFDDVVESPAIVGKMIREGLPLCDECQRCSIRDVCGGGYLPHRFGNNRGFDNPSVWCADIKKLVRHVQDRCGSGLESRVA